MPRGARVAACVVALAATQGWVMAGSAAGAVGHGRAEVFVSPDGDDRGPGTRHRPFKTIQRAQEAVRKLNDRMRGDVVVTLAGGTYRLSKPLELTAQDSGENGRTVVWRAAAGAAPVISGGRRIAGWQPLQGTQGIYRARARGLHTRQLYVGGRRATRARATLDRGQFAKTATGYDAYGVPAQILRTLARPSDAEFTSNVEWMGYRCGIDEVYQQGGELNATTTASSVDPAWPDFTARNAFDGDLATFWQSGYTPQEPDWVQVQFDAPVHVGRIVVRSRRFSGMVLQDVDVATGLGDEALMTRGTVRDNAQDNADFPFSFETPVRADRVRVTVTRESYGGQERPWSDIGEVELYAPDGSLIDVKGPRTSVTMDQPCFANANLRYHEGWNIGAPLTIENGLELLDEAGEWYLDDHAGWIYYKPRPGEELGTTDVVAPVLETLVRGQGTIRAPVHDIRFEGLTFADATWLVPSTGEGYAVDQTGFRFTGPDNPKNWGHGERTPRTPGNVAFAFAHRVAFERNHFTRLGAVALDFDTGSQHNAVVGNRFEDISAAAVQVGGVDPEDHHPSDRRMVTRDNRVGDNVIARAGQEYY
ncbi:MAG TPA: discoidin domain-containing protein, partial [Solirubrobacteraceae bacterium]|nr:discoidin domain-containing protein [Solirubrobacteraceae bacterium]